MIDEDELRHLLTEAAEAIPPPGNGPDALLAALAERAVASPRRKRSRARWVAAAAAITAAVVAVGATLAYDRTSTTTSRVALRPTSEQLLETEADGDLAEGGHPTVSPGGQGSVDRPDRADEAAPLTDSAKIIRTGSLDLEVREGTFKSVADRIVAEATGLGGYVAESTTSESDDSPSGSIVVRVPGDSFETLLANLRELGQVQAVTSKGTDVTAQFTDLGARLTALQATRDRLATVLSEAANVPDILAVQDRITGVQVEIESVQGQLKLLEDQTTFATLAVTLGEPGAEVIKADPAPDDGLGGAWDDARRRFGDSIEAIVSWSGSAAVVGMVALLLVGLGRLTWVGLRRRAV